MKNMKNKITALFLSAALAVSSAVPAFAYKPSTKEISICVDGTAVDFGGAEPIIENWYTYVPIRPVFEKLGTVDWDAETKAVIVTDEYSTMELFTDTGEIHVDGEEIVPYGYEYVRPIIRDGSTLLPVRAAAEALGASVTWNDDTESIDIYSYGYQLDILDGLLGGKPLPQAFYIAIFDDGGIEFNSKFGESYEWILNMADTDGYDELAAAIRRLESVTDEAESLEEKYYNEENLTDLLDRYTEAAYNMFYQFISDLDGMEDISFAEGLIGTVLQNTNVTVDESLTDEQSLRAIVDLCENDDVTTAEVNKKLAPLAKILSLDDNAVEDSLAESAENYFSGSYSEEAFEEFAEIMASYMILEGYAAYLLKYDESVIKAANVIEEEYGLDGYFDYDEGSNYGYGYSYGYGNDFGSGFGNDFGFGFDSDNGTYS